MPSGTPPWPPGAARIIRGTALPDSKPITGGGGHSIAQTRAALEGLVYYPPSITLIEQSLHKTRRFARTAALEHLVIALSCQGCYVMQHVQMYTLLANVVMLLNNHYIKSQHYKGPRRWSIFLLSLSSRGYYVMQHVLTKSCRGYYVMHRCVAVEAAIGVFELFEQLSLRQKLTNEVRYAGRGGVLVGRRRTHLPGVVGAGCWEDENTPSP